MAQFLPRFNPPRFTELPEPNLYKRFEAFLIYWNSYNQYVINHVGRLQSIISTVTGGPITPFKSIASAAIIRPLQEVQPVTGTSTIITINAPSDFTKLTLLSQDGFSLATGSNIGVDRTTVSGEQIALVKNLSSGLWYSIPKPAELTTHESNSDAHYSRAQIMARVKLHV